MLLGVMEYGGRMNGWMNGWMDEYMYWINCIHTCAMMKVVGGRRNEAKKEWTQFSDGYFWCEGHLNFLMTRLCLFFSSHMMLTSKMFSHAFICARKNALCHYTRSII